MGFRLSGLRFWVQVSGFKFLVFDLEFRVLEFGIRV